MPPKTPASGKTTPTPPPVAAKPGQKKKEEEEPERPPPPVLKKPSFKMEDDVKSTIQELNLYVKVKHHNVTYFLYVQRDTTAMEIKRMMKQFTNRRIHDIHLTIPRYNNRKFFDTLTFEQMILENGETLLMQLRFPKTDNYETIEQVTGDYDTITGSLYR